MVAVVVAVAVAKVQNCYVGLSYMGLNIFKEIAKMSLELLWLPLELLLELLLLLLLLLLYFIMYLCGGAKRPP